MYQISLVAAFISGTVALFAPCCISYLLPAYFGNIFKERKKILLMTIIYSLGIFTVMLPVVLGAKALSTLFFKMHDNTYIFGSILMLAIALLALLGIKLPMPRFKRQKQAVDVPSTYSLGIVSGITSSCCAPVLVGVITLSSLSPTLLQSLGVGASYVTGMVAPLYIASIFLHKGNILEKQFFQKQISKIKLGKTYPITIGNTIAASIFAISGIVMLTLTLQGKLAMSAEGAATTKTINQLAFKLTELTKSIPFINFIFAILLILALYKILKMTKKEK